MLSLNNSGILDVYPLTAMQRGMYFHAEVDRDEILYHDVFSLRLVTPWDEPSFRSAIESVLADHPVLRTSFEFNRFSQPMQVVHADGVLRLTVHDPGFRSEGEAESFVREQKSQLEQQAFDLNERSLIRFTVIRRSEDDFQLLVDAHHMILDGWSMASVLTGLFRYYLSNLGPRPSQSPFRCNTSFKDYVKAEIAEIRGDAGREFWRDYLADLDYRPLALGGVPGPARVRALKVPLVGHSHSLKALARAEGFSLKELLLAVHLRVCGFVLGATEVCSATISNCRLEVEGGDRVVGLFLNMLPLRVELRDQSWLDLVRDVRARLNGLMRHRRFPFPEMVKLQGNPVTDISFNFVHFHVYEAVQGIENFQVVDADVVEKSNFRLAVTFHQQISGDLELLLQYNTAALSDEDARRLAGYFRAAIEQVCDDPDVHYLDRSLLSPAELKTLWKPASLPEPVAYCPIHRMFERRTADRPDAVAIRHDGSSVSYAQLNRRANTLAHYLIGLGVTEEAVIAVYTDRSVGMVAALLAVLKAGAAYLPVDPDYPAARREFMLQQADVQFILASPGLAESLEAPDGCRIIVVDDSGGVEAATDSPATNPVSRFTPAPDKLAYVIFTSGSSGQPKGVMIEHGSISNLIAAMIRRMPQAFDDEARVLALTTICFDIATVEIFATLAVGGRVVLAGSDAARNPSDIAGIVEREGVTVIQATPSTYRLLADIGWRGSDSLTILSAGEPLPIPLAEYLLGAGRQLWNGYGPTEATVYSWVTEVTPAALRRGYMPLGRELEHYRHYVLDRTLQPVPPNVAGELYIGGIGVARGYLNRGDLTARSFLQHPVGDVSGTSLYRTGDLVRYRDDGSYEYLGRIDNQVKIRGLRIELGEVETQLAACAGIKEAVATVADDGHGGGRLQAYLVPDSVGEPDGEGALIGRARRELRTKLPDYMVPDHYQVVAVLPRTANGKLDRQALPRIQVTVAESERIEPRTQAEKQIAGIWAELLQIPVESISADSNFLELGGHSLLSIRLVAAMRRQLGLELSLREVYEAENLRALASLDGKTARPAIARVERDGDIVPLSFAQQRIWFAEQLRPDQAAYNMPAVLDVRGCFDIAAAERALSRIVARHETLRTRFIADDTHHVVQKIEHPGAIGIQTIDLSSLPDAEQQQVVDRTISAELVRPFDLAREVLLRVIYLTLSGDRGVLLFNTHHIVSDGWSMQVLKKEFETFYSVEKGAKTTLPQALAVRYSDYVRWQHESFSEQRVADQLDYWEKQLAGIPDVHELPLDFPRPAELGVAGAKLHLTIESDGLADLRALAKRHDVTLFMVLHGILAVLLSKYSGNDDIVIGAPVVNRPQSELEPLIGLFVNALVLRTRTDKNLPFAEFLKHVRQVDIDAQMHQEVPFEYLVENLCQTRSLSYSPMFQIVLTMADANLSEGSEEQVAGLSVASRKLADLPVKYDLAVEVSEAADVLHIAFFYNKQLFTHDTVARMAGHFRNLLSDAAARPAAPISDLRMLSARESEELIAETMPACLPSFEPRTLPALFERQVAQQPDRVAVTFRTESLTYAQLNERANKLAHHLIDCGVGPEKLVAVYLDQSVELIVSILAVLKAGGAYVPIDPVYPENRISFILEDTDAVCLLTHSDLYRELSDTDAPPVFVDDRGLTAGQPGSDPEHARRGLRPENLAYIIYTSGSTGRPKGVQVSHRNVSRLFDASEAEFDFRSDDVWAMCHSFAFDFSVWEMWGAFSHGARLVPVSPEAARAPDDLNRLLHEEKVTVLSQTPGAFAQLLAAHMAAPLELKLRYVVFGGEKLNLSVLKPWIERYGDAEPQFVNMYGITETTVHVTCKKLSRADIETSAHASLIGRPLCDLGALVLTPENEPCPPGVVGELYVSGAGLARGYLNRSALTAERFVENPLNGRGPDRLYKTGDLVRRLPSGELEYIGRADGQVKIRGYRIELGEIESQLAKCAGVEEVTVLARDDTAIGDCLVAYIVMTNGSEEDEQPQAERLRRQLRRNLPEYMVPAYFVFLDALPLTVNGKVDRGALRQPEQAIDLAAYVAPGNETEEALVDIWASVLDLPPGDISVNANFFELGGHSLLATRIVSAARERFRMEVPIRVLFEESTIAGFARRMEECAETELVPDLVPGSIHRGGREYDEGVL